MAVIWVLFRGSSAAGAVWTLAREAGPPGDSRNDCPAHDLPFMNSRARSSRAVGPGHRLPGGACPGPSRRAAGLRFAPQEGGSGFCLPAVRFCSRGRGRSVAHRPPTPRSVRLFWLAREPAREFLARPGQVRFQFVR